MLCARAYVARAKSSSIRLLAGAALVSTLAAVSSAGCKKSAIEAEPTPSPNGASTNVQGASPPPTYPAFNPSGPPADPRADPFTAQPAPAEEPRRVEVPAGTETLTVADDGGSGGIPAPPADPFDRAVEATRARAVGCFSTLPPAQYALVMVLNVSSGGRVTRSEIEPGNVGEPAVIDCVRQLGASSSFPSSTSARAVRIEVRVRG